MSLELSNIITKFVISSTGALTAEIKENVQDLWSGYGKILRYTLHGTNLNSVIVKWVNIPDEVHHPRGWNSAIGNQRKLRSYDVEHYFYKHWANRCRGENRVAHCIASQKLTNGNLLLLEDLDASGFEQRFDRLNQTGLEACIAWLAAFHAEFLGETPKGLWETGSYWHLQTRQEELQNMTEGALKKQAERLDKALNSARYQTIIHGDAKIANFCFSNQQEAVAAVDFQYIGAGLGVTDLAYFLGSCLNNNELFDLQDWCLETYFSYLNKHTKSKLSSVEYEELKTEWQYLYSVAVADFARFLEGWRPGHWKLNDYTQSHVDLALKQLAST